MGAERRTGAQRRAADRRRLQFPGAVGHDLPAQPAALLPESDPEAVDPEGAHVEGAPGDAVVDVPLSERQGSGGHVRLHPLAGTGRQARARLGAARAGRAAAVPEAGVAATAAGSARGTLNSAAF